ncbi:MAG: hypothetical protein IPK25_03475 [Saprospiraceae bacterium]|nr:hypothetical protein [Saprospiraceae bacterium]
MKGELYLPTFALEIRKILTNSFAEQYYETGIQNVEIEKVAQEGARNHGLLNIGVKRFFLTYNYQFLLSPNKNVLLLSSQF